MIRRISWPGLLPALLMLYACVQYVTGDKGYFSQANRKQDIAALSIELENLKSEREELSARARYLSYDSLSNDLLEERARVLLGLGDPHVYVIHDPQLRINSHSQLNNKSSPKVAPETGGATPKA
jgi:cell division protein FtsB